MTKGGRQSRRSGACERQRIQWDGMVAQKPENWNDAKSEAERKTGKRGNSKCNLFELLDYQGARNRRWWGLATTLDQYPPGISFGDPSLVPIDSKTVRHFCLH